MELGDVKYRNAVQSFPRENIIIQHYRDIMIGVSATRPFTGHCQSCGGDGESPTKHAMRTGHFGWSHQSIGIVDFALAFQPVTGGRWETTLVMAGGATHADVRRSVHELLAIPFEEALLEANNRVAAELRCEDITHVPEFTEPFERAVISLNDLYDENEGTFIAAAEFDPSFQWSGGYGYCWPRDAVICALALQALGDTVKGERFFAWAERTQLDSGHWYQRSWTDGSPGPSWCVLDHEIQLDQTCAMVHAAGLFARRLAGTRSGGTAAGGLGETARTFVERFRPMVARATQALLDHLDGSYLHKPAMDLWENSRGSFAYTQAGLWAALREAQEVFNIAPERTGPDVRRCIRDRLLEVFWKPERGQWLRRISPEGEEDATLDSSCIGLIYPWGVLDLDDSEDRQLALATLDGVSRRLRSEVKGGGAILRFEGEAYMGGGPGCVNTLWLALCRLHLAMTATEEAQRLEQRSLALDDIRIALANTNPTGQLPELIPKVHFDYWAAPHGWASALLIQCVLLMDALARRRFKDSTFDAVRQQVQRQAPSH
jgi:GH15 family glucan-1,4-alpha-glucosidase